MVKLSEDAQEALDTAKIDIKMNEIVNRVIKEKADQSILDEIEKDKRKGIKGGKSNAF